MKPSLSDAATNNSIYFTGEADLVLGWDFNTVWTVDNSQKPINAGLPTLRTVPHVTSITDDPDPLADKGTIVLIVPAAAVIIVSIAGVFILMRKRNKDT
jgi:hypothetical protein